MNDINVILAECPGLGRIRLCGCDAVHLSLGPVTITLAPDAFVQAAVLVRHALDQLTEIAAVKDTGSDPLESLPPHATRFAN
jgi:hypothetical protein